MQTKRWLLPFTHKVDLLAIDATLQLAGHSAATLVALSLLAPPKESHLQSIRLEQLEESKDFLEAVYWKAKRQQVAVESYEIFTEDVSGCIVAQIKKLDCQGIILITRAGADALLPMTVLKQLLMHPPAPLVLLMLPSARRKIPLGIPFFSRISQTLGYRNKKRRGQTPGEKPADTWRRRTAR